MDESIMEKPTTRPHPTLLEHPKQPANIQLLQIRKENNTATTNLIKLPTEPSLISKLPFLSLNYHEDDSTKYRPRGTPSLIRIPLKNTNEVERSKDPPLLIKLPSYTSDENAKHLLGFPKDHTTARKETKLIDMKPTISDQPKERKPTPLLGNPKINDQRTPVLVRIPLAAYQYVEQQKRLLLQMPIKEANMNLKNAYPIPKNKHILEEKNYSSSDSPKQNSIVIDKSLLPKENQVASSGNRRRRRKKKGKIACTPVSATGSINTSNTLIVNSSHSKDTIEIKPSLESQEIKTVSKSQETQTAPTQTKRKRKSRRLALMSLLEQASLFTGSDSSTDDDLGFLKNFSHVIKDEDYSLPERTPRASKNIESVPTPSRYKDSENNLEAGLNDKNGMDTKGVVNDRNNMQRCNPHASIHNSSHIKTNNEVTSLPRSSRQRPSNSVGLSWKEIIALSNGSSNNKANMEDKGIQAADFTDQNHVEQESQTDVSLATDVTSRLLSFYKTDKEKTKLSPRVITTMGYDPQIDDSNLPSISIRSSLDNGEIDQDNSSVPNVRFIEKPLDSHRILEEDASVDVIQTPTLSQRLPEDRVPEAVINEFQMKQQYAPSVPPEIFLQLNLDNDKVLALSTKAKPSQAEFINVVDVNPSQAPVFTPADSSEAQLKEQQLITVQTGHEKATSGIQPVSERHPVKTVIDDEKFCLSTVKSERKNTNKSEEKYETEFPASNLWAIPRKTPSVGSGMPDPSTSKSKLNNNLRELSVQLDALDDLHRHLESELKNSKLLMKTVDTIQEGFMADQVNTVQENKDHQWDGLERARQGRKPHQSLQFPWKSSPFSSVENYHAKKSLVETNEDLAENKDAHSDNEDSDNEGLQLSLQDIDDREHEFKEEDRSCFKAGSDRSSIKAGSGPRSESVEENDENKERMSDSDKTYGSRPASSRVSVANSHVSSRNEKLWKTEDKTAAPRSLKEDLSNKESDIKARIEKKRKALRDWMKNKRFEENQKYLKDLDNKRQSEFRPFIVKSQTKQDIETKDKEVADKKRIQVEENFIDRVESAETLMKEILSTKPSSPRPLKPFSTYERRRNISSSRHSQKVQVKRRKITQKGAISKGIKSKKNRINEAAQSSFNETYFDRDSKFSSRIEATNRTSNEVERTKLHRNRLQQSLQLTHDVSYVKTHRTTPRRSGEARDFVTSSSYSEYKKKTAKLVRDTIRTFTETDDIEIEKNFPGSKQLFGRQSGLSLNSNREQSHNSRTIAFIESNEEKLYNTGHLSNSERQNSFGLHPNSLTDTVDDLILKELLEDKENNGETWNVKEESYKKLGEKGNFSNAESAEDLNAILLQYGALDDDEVDLLASPETAMLLAEADAVLQNDTPAIRRDTITSQDTVDWDEVDRILNEP